MSKIITIAVLMQLLPVSFANASSESLKTFVQIEDSNDVIKTKRDSVSIFFGSKSKNYECSVRGEAFSKCSSPLLVSGLTTDKKSDEKHDVIVRDEAGNKKTFSIQVER